MSFTVQILHNQQYWTVFFCFFSIVLEAILYLLNYNISDVNDSLFYNYAINGLNNSSLSNLGKLYVNIISFVLNIFGSDIKYPIYFNIFLQLFYKKQLLE